MVTYSRDVQPKCPGGTKLAFVQPLVVGCISAGYGPLDPLTPHIVCSIPLPCPVPYSALWLEVTLCTMPWAISPPNPPGERRKQKPEGGKGNQENLAAVVGVTGVAAATQEPGRPHINPSWDTCSL